MTDPLVAISGLTKRFGAREVLRGVSVDIRAGEVVCVIGASGSGKSTLLRCLNLLESADEGRILFHGRDIAPLARSHGGGRLEAERNRLRARIGMVFQSFNLWPHLDVLANVMEAPLRVRKLAREQAEALARALLDKVGLGEFAAARPSRLSGGQQQRVAIARALAMEPEVLLFDEPTSALDPELTGEVLAVMRLLARDGATMVCVTHEMAFARAVASRVVFIDDGRVIEDGPPAQVIDAPREPRTRQFLARFHGAGHS
jgi:polar amino acid transport system ATP-binding protein